MVMISLLRADVLSGLQLIEAASRVGSLGGDPEEAHRLVARAIVRSASDEHVAAGELRSRQRKPRLRVITGDIEE